PSWGTNPVADAIPRKSTVEVEPHILIGVHRILKYVLPFHDPGSAYYERWDITGQPICTDSSGQKAVKIIADLKDF
ncbi:hypothetical protein, partial [Butyricicoccus sp.]|uniref:hypothetical protein n=1 Tax=Butyricicoccus sp. TaxID=2049021 RepID=UPI003736AEA5